MFRDRIKEFRRVPASDLRPNPSNWRRHPDAQRRALASMLESIGFAGALLARETPDGLVLIDGHLRADLADQDVPVLVLDVDEAEGDRLLATLDPLAAMAETDRESLRQLLETAEVNDRDLLAHLERTLGGSRRKVVFEADPNAIPTPTKPARVQMGDVWHLGDHVVIVGDGTDPDNIGVEVDAVVTDPPYSVAYDQSHQARGGSETAHDPYLEGDPSKILGFMAHLKTDVVVMTYPVDRHLFALADAIRGAGFELRKELVWVKDTFSFWPGADYQQRHEPILVLCRAGRPLLANVPAGQSTVFEIPRPKAHVEHPTARPVDLWEPLVRHHTIESVLDPFLGSGTTLVVAEMTGRRCVGVELNPVYAEVAIRRWERLTGAKASKARKSKSGG